MKSLHTSAFSLALALGLFINTSGAKGTEFRATYSDWEVRLEAPAGWQMAEVRKGGLVLQLDDSANNRGVQVYAFPRLHASDDAVAALQRFLGDLEARFDVRAFDDPVTGTLGERAAAYCRGQLRLEDSRGRGVLVDALITTYETERLFFTVWANARTPAPEIEIAELMSLLRTVRFTKAE